MTDSLVKFLPTRSVDINSLWNSAVVSALSVSYEGWVDNRSCRFRTICIFLICVWNISTFEHISKVSFLFLRFLWISISFLRHNLFFNGWQLGLFRSPVWNGVLFSGIALLRIINKISSIDLKQTLLVLVYLNILIGNDIISQHVIYAFSSRALERFFWSVHVLNIFSSKICVHRFFFLNYIEWFFTHHNDYNNNYG